MSETQIDLVKLARKAINYIGDHRTDLSADCLVSLMETRIVDPIRLLKRVIRWEYQDRTIQKKEIGMDVRVDLESEWKVPDWFVTASIYEKPKKSYKVSLKY